MIEVCDDCEYTILISDLIKDIGNREGEWSVNIWVSNREIPFTFSNEDDVLFLQEGIKFTLKNGATYYLFYDIIDNIIIF